VARLSLRLPFSLPSLGPRTRRIVRVVGFVVLALVTFVFALQLTFPYGRVKDKIVEVLSPKYDVQIADVERGFWPGRVYFKNVTLRTRVTKADDVASTLYVEKLQVDLGILALITATASVDLDAKIGGGHIAGNVSLSKGATEVHVTGKSLPSASLPMREALGLPMSGLIEFSFDLDLPNEKSKTGRNGANWQKAEGGAEFSCPSGCVFGDGKSKLKPKLKNTRNQAFASDGIEFGKLNIQSLSAKLEIKDGKMTISKFDAKSDDGQLFVEYEQTLAQEFNESTVTGCLRFTGSQALLKREPKTFAAISTTGAPLGPDNLYHIKLDGRLKDMKRLGIVCGKAAGEKHMDNVGGQPSKPNLTIQPEEQVRPPTTPTPTFTPPPAIHDAGVVGDAPAAPTPPPPPEMEGQGSAGSAAAPTGAAQGPVGEPAHKR